MIITGELRSSSLLQGYRDQIRSEEMATMVPPQLLQGKEDVLFGNLNELYNFHNDVFLKDLENCISTTELVALCFVQRVSGRVGLYPLGLVINVIIFWSLSSA